jgi:hypothetical protein
VGTSYYEALELIEEQAMARLARKLLGEEMFDHLAAYCYKVYPGPDYWMGFWGDVITGGKRVVYKQHLEFDPARVTQWNSDGRHLVEDAVFPPGGWTPPMTREQWEETFGVERYRRLPQPDDGGLAQKLEEFFVHQQRLREQNGQQT